MSDVIPKKSLGQHWLHDEETLNTLVASAQLQHTDTVIEIGPGLGTLTQKLLETGAHVIAIEYDTSLLEPLKARFEGVSNFELIEADILAYNFTGLPAGYKIVANIPYYLTSHLLRILSDSINKPARSVLLLQKEVAERVCAAPPAMSILSVAVQIEFATELGMFVPARLFTPPPKVDSQALVLTLRDEVLLPADQKKQFMQIVKAGFSAKRKTLRNTISAGLLLPKGEAEALLTSANIDFGRRAETLTLQEWITLMSLAAKA